MLRGRLDDAPQYSHMDGFEENHDMWEKEDLGKKKNGNGTGLEKLSI